MPAPCPLTDILYQALNTRLGLIVDSESATALRAKLYPLRAKDAELARLTFVICPTNPVRHLWIVLKPKPAEAQADG